MSAKLYFNSSLMRALRRRGGETQEELADALGVHIQQVHRWETGKASASRKNMRRLGDHYNVDWTLFQSRTDAIAWDNATLLVAEKSMKDTADPDALKDALALGALPSAFPEDTPVSTAESQGSDWLDEADATQSTDDQSTDDQSTDVDG
ncbi:MAG: helix-turn-helix transcriptional regulator [Candidatus Poribacteria bacterium]|nr:helix-turn-helix transcriptional regulator [Candidatus Poribacteria bacterium]